MSKAAVADRKNDAIFVCARCDVTVQWMKGHDAPKSPANWAQKNGEHYCLACRRDLAADAALEKAPEGMSLTDRAKLQSAARIHFEVKRDPTRADGEIAKSCGASIASVGKARKELGLVK